VGSSEHRDLATRDRRSRLGLESSRSSQSRVFAVATLVLAVACVLLATAVVLEGVVIFRALSADEKVTDRISQSERLARDHVDALVDSLLEGDTVELPDLVAFPALREDQIGAASEKLTRSADRRVIEVLSTTEGTGVTRHLVLLQIGQDDSNPTPIETVLLEESDGQWTVRPTVSTLFRP